jgi:hypothetical protein
MFMVALIIKAKTRKQPKCPSNDDIKGILFKHKKDCGTDIYYNMNEP